MPDIQLFYIFLGSFLSFLATALVEEWKNKRETKSKQESYRTYARLQLNSVLNVLSKLKYSYESNSRYKPRDIALLVTAMEPLNGLRSDTTTLPDSSSQEKLIELIADLNLYIADIKDLSAQDASTPSAGSTGSAGLPVAAGSGASIDNANAGTVVASTWIEKNVELIDLRRRCEELIKSLA